MSEDEQVAIKWEERTQTAENRRKRNNNVEENVKKKNQMIWIYIKLWPSWKNMVIMSQI